MRIDVPALLQQPATVAVRNGVEMCARSPYAPGLGSVGRPASAGPTCALFVSLEDLRGSVRRDAKSPDALVPKLIDDVRFRELRLQFFAVEQILVDLQHVVRGAGGGRSSTRS
jgi:hypothetical protein